MSADNKLEKEQATLRIIVISIVFGYAFFVVYIGGMSGDVSRQLFKYGVLYAFASVVLRILIAYGIFGNLFRRSYRSKYAALTVWCAIVLPALQSDEDTQ